MKLTQQRAHELFSYDPESGQVRWKVRRRGKDGGVHPGDVAGYECPIHGYWMIGVDGENLRAHRVIWLMMLGAPVPEQVDHRDGCRSNNKWSNLRASSHGLNQQNVGKRPSESGYRGVYRCQSKWMAQIQIGRKRRYLGLFPTKEEASAAYLSARSELFTYQPVPRELCEGAA